MSGAISDDGRRVLVSFGETVRKRREELGWSVSELARAVGKSWGWVAGMERGEREVGVGPFAAIIDVLGLDARSVVEAWSEDGRAA